MDAVSFFEDREQPLPTLVCDKDLVLCTNQEILDMH